ncbi:hypothetical protein QFZ60_001603 [Arthrobacter sp. B2I5]|uniref:hypothetical protein n=1 Tax=Arthrobacter sp. B2I5 TaxID=3042266 RepID=UPI002780AAD0|nr:hypothetical protein [Arthrobacter sp. B2I5]MDQ0825430.1 hypothetical protein [Arthrobacter sp. B2I5]
MNPRLNQQQENQIIQRVKNIDDGLRELKTGVQYAEAKMYEYSSGNSYDFSGSLPASTTPQQVVALLIVTATSVDNAAFISTFVPELWMPNMSTPYKDILTSAYYIQYNKIITDDVSKTQYYLSIVARASGTAASTFYLKARIYATVPVTVTYARQI